MKTKPNPNTHTTNLTQEWRAEAETRTQTHTAQTPARIGEEEAERAHRHRHPNSPARNSPAEVKIHTQTNPTQAPASIGQVKAEHAHRHTRPSIKARIGGLEAKPDRKHTHHKCQPGFVSEAETRTQSHTTDANQDSRGRGGACTQTHTPQRTSQDWHGDSKIRNQTHTAQTPARTRGVKPNSVPKHTHRRPQPPLAWCRKSPYLYPRAHTREASQEWPGKGQNPKPYTRTAKPHPGMAGSGLKPNPNKSRKPSLHSWGTESAQTMQVTRPNVTRTPGVRLHPKACAAVGLKTKCATPYHHEDKYQDDAARMPWQRDTSRSPVNP